mgnify:CR=1 FL=1
MELLHISFVTDSSAGVPEIPKPKVDGDTVQPFGSTKELTELQILRMDFWSNFVNYCRNNGRMMT